MSTNKVDCIEFNKKLVSLKKDYNIPSLNTSYNMKTDIPMNKQNKIIFSTIFIAITLSVASSFLFLNDSKDSIGTSDSGVPIAFSQEFNSLSKNNPTIKVTGDASMTLEPDQATIMIATRSQPTDITTALEEQKQGIKKIINAIRDSVGEETQEDFTEIKQGRFGLDQYYMGEESYSNIDTFTVRSTTSVDTDIEQFSDVVNRLTDEGYTFESVYANHRFPGPFAYSSSSFASGDESMLEGLEIEQEEGLPTEEEADESNQITLNIAVSTKPAPINDAVEAYEEKHQKLLQILTEEIGIAHEKIQPANVNINPLYYGPVNQNSLYNSYSQIFVKTNPDNIEKIISAVNEHDAFVENVMITISDEKLSGAEDDLNLAAFNNAKQKAEKMAQMTGLKVGGVQSIESITEPMEQRRTFHGNLYPVDPWRYNDAGEVGVSVTVEFELEK